jgi:hypothetical protein
MSGTRIDLFEEERKEDIKKRGAKKIPFDRRRSDAKNTPRDIRGGGVPGGASEGNNPN